MAQAEHLPIYKASYDLCLYIEQVVRGSSRYHKYALGADRSPAVELLGVQPSAEADAGCFENPAWSPTRKCSSGVGSLAPLSRSPECGYETRSLIGTRTNNPCVSGIGQAL